MAIDYRQASTDYRLPSYNYDGNVAGVAYRNGWDYRRLLPLYTYFVYRNNTTYT